MPKKPPRRILGWFAAGALASLAPGVATAQGATAPAAAGPTYADLADLSESANLVIVAKVRKAIALGPDRVSGPTPGTQRYYIVARTLSLLAGSAPVGEDLSYLVDVPQDPRGKAAKLKNMQVLLFANPVPGRPGELQLVTPRAQVAHAPDAEATVRAIVYELLAPDAPARVTGVREAIHVPGALEGEGETQIFLATQGGSAASITVNHRPGQRPAWGVSFSELVGRVGVPPARDTLAWYRLACFLPNSLPRGANLSGTPASRAQAEADYRMVLGDLGLCPRTLN